MSRTSLQQIIKITSIMFILLLVGCSTPATPTAVPTPIKKGMPKNDVIENLGKPNEWVTVTSDEQVSVALDFNLESTKGSMPAGELWMFEYMLPEGIFTVHFSNNEVVDVVKGPILKE